MEYCKLSAAKEYAEKKITEAYWKEPLFHGNMKFPKIEWKAIGKNRAGYATYSTNTITLNSNYLHSKDWKKFLNETPLHEFAHLASRAVWGTMGHDKNWKYTCRMVGLTGERCHDFATPENLKSTKKMHVVYCNCMQHEISDIRYRRMKAGMTVYRCAKCLSKLHE